MPNTAECYRKKANFYLDWRVFHSPFTSESFVHRYTQVLTNRILVSYSRVVFLTVFYPRSILLHVFPPKWQPTQTLAIGTGWTAIYPLPVQKAHLFIAPSIKGIPERTFSFVKFFKTRLRANFLKSFEKLVTKALFRIFYFQGNGAFCPFCKKDPQFQRHVFKLYGLGCPEQNSLETFRVGGFSYEVSS